jgi:hypothetical protein
MMRTPLLLKSMAVPDLIVLEILSGKQAVHPPFMMLTQVQAVKARVRNRKQEEGEKKMKTKIEKKAKKLMMKRIKDESEKHPFFGLNHVPHNYASISLSYFSISIGSLGKTSFL